MAHKKKAHSKGVKEDKQHRVGLVEPMAHGKGSQNLKPMKKGHKDASGK